MNIQFELLALIPFRKYIVFSTLPDIKNAHLYIGCLKPFSEIQTSVTSTVIIVFIIFVRSFWQNREGIYLPSVLGHENFNLGHTEVNIDVGVFLIDHFQYLSTDSQTMDITHFAVVFNYDVTIEALEILRSTAKCLWRHNDTQRQSAWCP